MEPDVRAGEGGGERNRRVRLIAVGACYIDTILDIPHFPQEDLKLRATQLRRRRGGNPSNTLEVLQQLVYHHNLKAGQQNEGQPLSYTAADSTPNLNVALSLITTLPHYDSEATRFIARSFNADAEVQNQIDLSHCIYRNESNEAASAYIFNTKDSGSRTIVSYNELEDMSFEELKVRIDDLCDVQAGTTQDGQAESFWFHFEGRNVDVVENCMVYLRQLMVEQGIQITISVEVERPGRVDLRGIAALADVVFYSRSWAVEEGYQNAVNCVKEETLRMKDVGDRSKSNERWSFCTWGEEGAAGMYLQEAHHQKRVVETQLDENVVIVDRPAWRIDPSDKLKTEDPIGAGDTWTAGMLYALLADQRNRTEYRDNDALTRHLDFANEVAGRKICRYGFGELGAEMLKSV